MQPVLEKASIDTAKLLISVTADQKQADEQAAVVAVDVSEANKVAAAVKVSLCVYVMLLFWRLSEHCSLHTLTLPFYSSETHTLILFLPPLPPPFLPYLLHQLSRPLTLSPSSSHTLYLTPTHTHR